MNTEYAGFDAIDKSFNTKQLERRKKACQIIKRYKMAHTKSEALIHGKDISDKDAEKFMLEIGRIEYNPIIKDFC